MGFKRKRTSFLSVARFVGDGAKFVQKTENRFAVEEEEDIPDIDKSRILKQIFNDKRKSRERLQKHSEKYYKYLNKNKQNESISRYKNAKRFGSEIQRNNRIITGYENRWNNPERSNEGYAWRVEQRHTSYDEAKRRNRATKNIRTYAGYKETEGKRKEEGRFERANEGQRQEKTASNKPDRETKKAASRAQVASIVKQGKLKGMTARLSTVSGNVYIEKKAPVKEDSFLKTLGAVFVSDLAIILLISILSMALLPVTLGMFVSIHMVSESVSMMMQGFPGRGSILSEGSLSEEQINQIVAESGATGSQERVIRFALSRVGYAYSQAARTSGSAYDCSSLAYYSWLEAGTDISYGEGYPPTAAVMASRIYSNGTVVSSTGTTEQQMQPGDLIFYGGHDNGRYLGIYHVAIYIGNGEVVEALNEQHGIVYGTIRTRNVIMVLRP
ncbi:MAG: C40 family peptidase [Lachnospiraceae bacterium]|nr:C40 family peptidase [Lachnospiraceae bacterium]